ncbi:MAG: homoserine dehydrogenase [Erysipelotrichaceae bacterium]|nr:homoserine dehydrogenase [Erysipelotrichaceae bacterium]
MKQMNIAILGYGVIGKGVFEICKNMPNINVVKIFDRKEKFDNNYLDLFTDNAESIFKDKKIDLIVEVLGGYEFARDMMLQAIKYRKHVVTANKEVVAKDIDLFVNVSRANEVCFAYEASVGGGIPIIKNIKQLKAVNTITKISGILNGTTNFILTKMFEGLDFNEALKEAQRLGFAEADPTADLEGYDMMRKIAILSDLAWNTFININEIKQTGITKITKEDVDAAKANNKVIKFVCESVKVDDHIEISVEPKVLDNTHFFNNVNNEFNAVILETYPNDTLTFIGKGAGSLPTASAIVLDIVDIMENRCLVCYDNERKYKIN